MNNFDVFQLLLRKWMIVHRHHVKMQDAKFFKATFFARGNFSSLLNTHTSDNIDDQDETKRSRIFSENWS